ncbi:MAG: SRPBCC family protein [Steroidobacteraceae bacterium]
MAAFEASALIAADTEQIWGILTDPVLLAGSDLGITRLEGTIQGGGRIRLWSEVAPGRAFALRVGVFDRPCRMTWEDRMPLGLFKGVRTFTLTPEGKNVRLLVREEFSGLMAPLIAKSMPDLTPSFRKFVDGVKSLAERRA